ncbi:MAG: hypothetical protein ACYC7J_05375 [Syntrophales bacterium]
MNICSVSEHLWIIHHPGGFSSQTACLSVLEEHYFSPSLPGNLPRFGQLGGCRGCFPAIRNHVKIAGIITDIQSQIYRCREKESPTSDYLAPALLLTVCGLVRHGQKKSKGARMRLSRSIVCFLAIVFVAGFVPGIVFADEFKIAIVRDDRIPAQQYEPLVAHIAKTGDKVNLVEAPTSEAVAKMMAAGEVDAMFSGSGIPGSMMVIHDLKQQRFFANFKKPDAQVKRLVPSQSKLN